MACDFEEDAQSSFDRIKNTFSAKVLGGGEVIPESNEWYVVANDYAMYQELTSYVDQQFKERDPRFACCENLLDLAAEKGIFPRAATFAEGYVQITGTVGTAITAPVEFTFNGQAYTSIGAIDAEIPASGTAVVRIQATTPGPDGNVSISTTGTVDNQDAAINTSVTFFGSNLCGGQDDEIGNDGDCEAFRTRFLARQRYNPIANRDWIESKILEWPCVTRVCVREGNCCALEDDCGCSNCGGRHEYYVMMDGTFDCGLPPQCVVDEIESWLFGANQGQGTGQVPFGVCGNLFTATAAPIDVKIINTSCLQAGQISEIRNRITEFFGTLCPSGMVVAKDIDLIMRQVTGTGSRAFAELRSDSENVSITNCGDAVLDCDYMPCLNSIEFIDEPTATGGCVQ